MVGYAFRSKRLCPVCVCVFVYMHAWFHGFAKDAMFTFPSLSLPLPPQVLARVMYLMEECWREDPHARPSSLYLKYTLLKLSNTIDNTP